MPKCRSIFEVKPGDYARLVTEIVNAPPVYEEIKVIRNVGPGKKLPHDLRTATVDTIEGTSMPIMEYRSFHLAEDMNLADFSPEGVIA